MTDDRNDDRLDEQMRSAASGYNRPPDEVPRESIWTAIQAARAAVAPRPTAVSPIRGTIRRWVPIAAGIAATLLIGVSLGRWTAHEEVARAGATSPAALGTREASSGGDRPASLAPYQVATMQHFSQAEALLVSFRTQSPQARLDRRVESWARDLLGTTRLLLDSPAGDDAERRQLLERLELVLAQIAQLGVGNEGEERQLIDRSIEKDDMMSRLRSAIPAGAAVSGT